ncbi:reverse transcriptase domain-containing protein, partial [Tanacetum coccineum]
IVFSARKFDKAREEQKKLKGNSQKTPKGFPSCVDTKERIVVNEKYPEQTIIIGKQLPTSFKIKLQDFTDINKACPKDHHPLPAIDQKVEVLSKFRLKCFLDAYKGYHHIQMVERDEEKTAFFIREGLFCYKRLPFGLKNARATYQNLVDKVYNDKIGCNLEVHVDDMVIKSDSEEDMLVDIKETFDKLQAINMKLNPSKCSLGIEEGPFMRHLITKQGIKANPSKKCWMGLDSLDVVDLESG